MDTQQNRSDDEFWKFRAEQPQHVIFDISVVPPRMVVEDTEFLDIEGKLAALGISPELYNEPITSSFSFAGSHVAQVSPLGLAISEAFIDEFMKDFAIEAAHNLEHLALGEGVEGVFQKRSFDYELIGGL